jgi:protein SCO1
MTTPIEGNEAHPPRRIRRIYVAAAALVVAALVVMALGALDQGWLGGVGGPSASAVGGPFSLVDQDGRRVSEKTFLGKPTAIFFGYTNCPDACPTTLMDMTERLKALGADGDKFNVLFVSLDPDRDTTPVLKAYLESFDPRIMAATGTEAEIKDMAAKFRLYYRKVGEGDGYTFDHSAAVYLMDAEGRFVTLIGYQEAQDAALAKMRQALTAG